MLAPDMLPKPFEGLAPIESHLLFVVVLALLLRHTHGLLCAIFGVPENWFVLLVKLLAKRF